MPRVPPVTNTTCPCIRGRWWGAANGSVTGGDAEPWGAASSGRLSDVLVVLIILSSPVLKSSSGVDRGWDSQGSPSDDDQHGLRLGLEVGRDRIPDDPGGRR